MDNRKDKITTTGWMAQYQHILSFTLAITVLCLACATPVYAAGALSNLCTIVSQNMTSGGVAPAVASIAVIGLGVGASLGRVSWTSAVVVAVGIAVIFGYASIVGELSGGTQGCS